MRMVYLLYFCSVFLNDTIRMELRQLKYFVNVAETNSFSEASRLLNITQSTLSQQIKQLENELGVMLFERSSHRVCLTDIGEAFLPEAKRALHAADVCIDRMNDIKGLKAGCLNIGSTFSFLPLLKDTVLLFMKEYPDIKLNIHCHDMETLIRMVKDRELDVALSYKPTSISPEIESHILFDNQLAVVVSEHHPLAGEEKVKFADIKRFPLVMPAKGLQARNAFDLLTRCSESQFNVRLEINEVNVIIDLVRSSKFLVTVISQAAVSHITGIKVITLDHQNTQMEGSFHILKDSNTKRSTKEFLKMLCENKSYNIALLDML